MPLFIDYFGFLGMQLSPEQKSAMQSSLPILQNEMHFQKLYFWGKIRAPKEYFIVQGVENNLVKRKTLVSQDCSNWALLSPATSETCKKVRLLRTFFSGDMSNESEQKVHHSVVRSESKRHMEKEEDTDDRKDAEEDTEDLQQTVETFIVKEEDRLAAVVAEIDRDALLVPRGAFILSPTGLVRENRFFQGLSTLEAGKLDSYYHFRPAERLLEKTMLQRADLERTIDFLDTASDDLPAGIWSVQKERGGAVVLIKNLLWQGYAFFHVPGTRHFGSLYMGEGRINIDLPFML